MNRMLYSVHRQHLGLPSEFYLLISAPSLPDDGLTSQQHASERRVLDSSGFTNEVTLLKSCSVAIRAERARGCIRHPVRSRFR
jgi:hypothetical protein